MSSRLLILAAVAVIAASPLLSTAWQDPAKSETQQSVPMYDYGTVYVHRVPGNETASVRFGLELGPDQSWHFASRGRIARLVEAANETSWEPELLSDDGDSFANAMLNDLKLHPDRVPTGLPPGRHIPIQQKRSVSAAGFIFIFYIFFVPSMSLQHSHNKVGRRIPPRR